MSKKGGVDLNFEKDCSFQERVDRIALFYISNHYDVKEMDVSEFLKKFNETGAAILDCMKESR